MNNNNSLHPKNDENLLLCYSKLQRDIKFKVSVKSDYLFMK